MGSNLLEERAPQWSEPGMEDHRDYQKPSLHPEPGLSLSVRELLGHMVSRLAVFLHPLVLKQAEACSAESMRTRS